MLINSLLRQNLLVDISIKRFLVIFSLFIFPSFVFSQTDTMYWIGDLSQSDGRGDWSILNNWSYVSGIQSSPQPSAIPGPNTVVVFDANSRLSGITDASRTITVNSEYSIKSLIFKPSLTNTASNPIIFNRGDYHMRVTGDVQLQVGVTMNSNYNFFAYSLIMQPALGEVSNLYLNGNQLDIHFQKEGMGVTNISETINSSKYFSVTAGTLNYSASTINVNNITFSNSSVSNFNNLITFQSIGVLAINDVATVNLPNVTTMSVYAFGLYSTTPLNLPSLQTFTSIAQIAGSNSASTLNLPISGGAILDMMYMNYMGNLSAGNSEFLIKNGVFAVKDGTHVYKVTIKNLVNDTQIQGSCIIDELIFENVGAMFVGNCEIGIFTPAPSKNYSIIHNYTLTITGSVTPTTLDCTSYWTLSGGAGGYYNNTSYTSNFNNNTGSTLELRNVVLARINAINTSNLTEALGVDLESNTGNIVFVEPVSKDIFWVGDAGNNIWNDILNWSASSNGIGGYCVPTRFDNVYFDNGSIITGSINSLGAKVHDIFIQNNAPSAINFYLGDIECYGSWYMRSGVSFENTASVFFIADDLGETITSNSSAFHRVYFRGLGGWIVQDDFKSTERVFFQGGTLNTNSQDIYIENDFFGQDYFTYPEQGQGGYRSLILGSSTLSINIQWDYNHLSNMLDAGASHIIFRNSGPYTTQMRNRDGHVYHDVSSLASNVEFRIEGSVTFNHVLTRAKNTTFVSSFIANEVSYVSTPMYGSQYSVVHENSTIGTLNLSSNISYIVNNGRSLTILNDIIDATPNCSGLMVLSSSAPSSGQFSLIKTLGAIHLDNVRILGVNATGGASFTANGLNEMNNSGWVFVEPVAKELYWVGFIDNNWNNGNNWTTNTDGTPSGGCVPTRYDNVHFNSFSTQNLPIQILGQDATFNNLITHSDAPNDIHILSSQNLNSFAYGNLIQLKQGMHYEFLNLVGNVSDGLITGTGSFSFGNLTVNNVSAIWNIDNSSDITIRYYFQMTANNVVMNLNRFMVTYVDINSGDFTLNASTSVTSLDRFQINSVGKTIILNTPIYTSNNNIFLYYGTFIMQDVVANIRGFHTYFWNTTLDIRNSNITARFWEYGVSGSTLYSDNSEINIGESFRGANGHQYNIIRTTGGTDAMNHPIDGSMIINKLILNHSRQINGDNTIQQLYLAPRNITLKLNNGTTQIITEDLSLNGSPCMFNTLRAVSTSATISYFNPNNHNRYDYVLVGGINATIADLEFDVNSSVLPSSMVNNNKVIFLSGTPGLIGLGNNVTCRTIDLSDPTSHTISASGFYGGGNSIYKWYKKNSIGAWELLNVPSTTVELNVLNHGINGEYQCVIVYDSTMIIANQCNTSDAMVFSSTIIPTVTLTTSNSSICYGNTIAIGGNVTAIGPWTLTLSDGQTFSGNDTSSWNLNVSPLVNTNYSIVNFEDDCNTVTGSGVVSISLPPSSNNLSIDGESASCISTGSGWIQFRNSTSGRLLVAIDLQSNDLGNISATSYVQNSPFNVAACGSLDPANATAVLGRRWVITPDHQPITPVKVRLYFDDFEYQSLEPAANSNANPYDDVFTYSDLQLSKYHNDGSPLVNNNPHDNCSSGLTTIWAPQGSGVISSIISGFDSNGRYTDYEISDFSEFWLHGSTIMSPLSVELINFNANCEEGNIKRIEWSTASEQNSSHFIVERSQDGFYWERVKHVLALNHSSEVANYVVEDTYAGNDIYYRLNQVDFDGKVKVFNPIYLKCSSGLNNLIVYPNPSNGIFQVQINAINNIGISYINIQDVTGKIVLSETIKITKGVQTAMFDSGQLAPGAYIVTVITQTSDQFIPVKLIVE